MKTPETTYLIDSNIILRYLLNDHPEQSIKSKEFMLKLHDGKIKAEIPAFILAECVYVMEKFYHIPRKKIGDSLKKIFNFSGIVNTNKARLLNAVIKFEESSIDISDCMLTAYSSPEKMVVSFDNDMKKLKAFHQRL